MINEQARDMLKAEIDLLSKTEDITEVCPSESSTSDTSESNEDCVDAGVVSRSPSIVFGTSKKVTFSTLQIREFGIIPGDNPSVTGGCPLSICWEYDNEFTCSVDDYEETRPKARSMTELRIPSRLRDERLRRVGFSRKEIQECTKYANITRLQRRRTTETMKLAPVQEFLERAKRKTLHLVGAGSKRKERELMKQIPVSSTTTAKSPTYGNDELRHSVETVSLDASLFSLHTD